MAIFSAGEEGVETEAEAEAVAEPSAAPQTARANPSAPYSSRVYPYSDSDSSIETSGGGRRKRRRILPELPPAPTPAPTGPPESPGSDLEAEGSMSPEDEEEAEFTDEAEEESESDGEQEPPPAEVTVAEKPEESRLVPGPACERSIKFTLLDPDILNCRICFRPLGSPIYQCKNGHVACLLCCGKLKNMCPECMLPIGDNRCRGLEKFLESIRVACMYSNYGCEEMVSYQQRNEHEMCCSYCPCLCPLSCTFLGSFKQLSRHYSEEHPGSGTGFHFNSSKSIFLRFDTKFHVLQEQDGNVLFLLHNSMDSLGNKIAISCIGPPSKRDYVYEVVARYEQTYLKLQAFTRNIRGSFDVPHPSSQYLMIPTGFFFYAPTMKLEFTIKDYRTKHV